MVLDAISDMFYEKTPKPNKYTIVIGKQIQQARNDANLSQAELAKRIYCRRSTISDIETGKADVDAVTLALIAFILDKPIIYFFPGPVFLNLQFDELSEFERVLILQLRRLEYNDREKIFAQIKAIADMNKSTGFR